MAWRAIGLGRPLRREWTITAGGADLYLPTHAGDLNLPFMTRFASFTKLRDSCGSRPCSVVLRRAMDWDNGGHPASKVV